MTFPFSNWWPSNSGPTTRMDTLQSENNYLRAQHEAMSSTMQALEYQNSILHRDQRALFAEHDQALGEQEQLREQIKAKDERVHELERALGQQQQLQAQVKSKDEKIRELQHSLGQQRQLQGQIRAKDKKIHELQEEVLQYKKSISSSTRLEKQLSDASIQSAMDNLFYAVRDWALDVVRHEKTVLLSVDNTIAQWLCGQLPGYKKGSSTWKANSLIALVSDAIVASMEEGWVFGCTSKDSKCSIAAANCLHESIQKTFGVASKKKKQWVLLTNEFLSRDEEAVRKCRKLYVESVVRYVRDAFGCDGVESSSIALKLQSAIEPHVHIIQALYHQEADYSMNLPLAMKGKNKALFIAKYMDDVSGEDKGVLQACFFPMVIKETANENDTELQRTVICKAKVMVES